MILNLTKKVDQSKSGDWLIYTSAGENANVAMWLKGNTQFDLWITYYGDEDENGNRLEEQSDYYNRRKGSKWQNLSFAYTEWPEIFKQYSAIFVMDDDIVITAKEINRLFKIREEYGLNLLQPAFSPLGKISHLITHPVYNSYIRFTNFVECNVPLFETEILEKFMKVYDEQLVGYGTDYWYSHLAMDGEESIAVVDGIVCTNPKDSVKKAGKRDIDKLQSEKKRKKVWSAIKEKHRLPVDEDHKNFSIIQPSGKEFIRVNMNWLYLRMRYYISRLAAKLGMRDI
jgi:hypothetical protein